MPQYKLSDGAADMLREARREPYLSINTGRGTSIDYLEAVLAGLGGFLQRFEHEVGLNGASAWLGARIHEVPSPLPLADIVAENFDGLSNCHYDKNKDLAIIPLEHYETWSENRHFRAYTLPRFALTRAVYTDAYAHTEKSEMLRLENKAMEAAETLKEPDRNLIGEFIKALNSAYNLFRRDMYELAFACFQAEAYQHNPSLMKQFGIPIELPASKNVIDALRETKAPVGYKPCPAKGVYEEQIIGQNLGLIDLGQLNAECLGHARTHVSFMQRVCGIFYFIACPDPARYKLAINEFNTAEERHNYMKPADIIRKHIETRLTNAMKRSLRGRN